MPRSPEAIATSAGAATDFADQFDIQVGARLLTIGVVGLGYTGLPLAQEFAQAGFPVVGFDLDARRVASVNSGESYLPDITGDQLRRTSGNLKAVTDPASLGSAQAVIMCVPTPLTRGRKADLSYVDNAVECVLPVLRPNVLLVMQSTVPPGTTTAIARRITARTGLQAGRNIHVAMAPERLDPGNTRGWRLRNTPKLIGGVTLECRRRAVLLFEQICTDVVPVSSPEVAELAKIFENTFRMVNIGLSMELADLSRSLRIPVRDVIDAAATKPFGFMAHYPGPGVGGECIPVDPLFLLQVASHTGISLDLINAAAQRVARRPQQVVDRVGELLRQRRHGLRGARILLVGVSYKPGVADMRNAPSIEIVRRLRHAGARLSYCDPLVPSLAVDGEPVRAVPWSREQLADQDCTILITAHPGTAADPLWRIPKLVLDTRSELPALGNVEVL